MESRLLSPEDLGLLAIWLEQWKQMSVRVITQTATSRLTSMQTAKDGIRQSFQVC